MSALKMIALVGAVGLIAAGPHAAEAQKAPPPSAQRLEGASWSTGLVRADPGLKDATERTGREVFQARCEACHGEIPRDIGPGLPARAGTAALQAKYKGAKPALLEERLDLTPEQVRFYVRHGISIMPFFRKTEVSDADLDAIGAYIARAKR